MQPINWVRAYPLHTLIRCVLGTKMLAHNMQQLVPAHARPDLSWCLGQCPSEGCTVCGHVGAQVGHDALAYGQHMPVLQKLKCAAVLLNLGKQKLN